MKNNSKKFIAFCVMAITCSSAVFSQTTLPTIISTDYTCSAGTTYLIDGKVFVTGGATLFIDPGVTLKAVKKAAAIDKSALIITRNGKIEAGGEITAPIVFTSNEAVPSSGDWGGVIILGEAPNNRITNPLIEGIDATSVPAPLTVADVQYGPIPATSAPGVPSAGIPNDNSGFMTYCRIEWAGAILGVANELNGLTCGSVGNGTNLEFIEVTNAFDDSFEFFGGTVNAKYLVSHAPDDDAFDFDFGYTGNLQFLVSVLNPNKPTYSSDPSGIESDGEGTVVSPAALPLTRPRISNLTMIGLQDSLTAGINTGKRLLNGARFRRQSSLLVSNSIFMGYNTGVRFEDAQAIADGPINWNYNIVHAFRALNSGATPNATNTPSSLGLSDPIAAFDANFPIGLVDPFNDSGSPDFRPGPGSPALSGANFGGTFLTAPPAAPAGFFQTVSYRGAFAPNVNWMRRWTRFPDFN